MQGSELSHDLRQVALLEQPGGSSSHGMCMCMHLFTWPQLRSPDEERLRLASGHEDGSLLVWDCSTHSCLASLRLFKEPAMALAASASGPGGGCSCFEDCGSPCMQVLYALHLRSGYLPRAPVMDMYTHWHAAAGILVSSASTAMALAHFDAGSSSLCLAKRMALDKAGCDQVR